MAGRGAKDLSAAEARSIVLASQGLNGQRSGTDVGPAQVLSVARRLGAIQIDSVNVLVRAHYVPMFSRLGPYDTRSLDRLTSRPLKLFEYLGHAASFLPVELHPLFRWRMARFADTSWNRLRARVESDRPGYVDTVLKEVAERGPLSAGELTEQGKRERVQTKYSAATAAWWNWSDGKDVLEGLHRSGRLAIAGRRGFERLYDLTERVIPRRVQDAPTPPFEDSTRALVNIAARALGIATLRDLSDYFRLSTSDTRERVQELVEEGQLRPVRAEGWADQAFLHREAGHSVRSPGVETRTLVSPFDSLMWDRARTERVFGFRYRIEIYVPGPRRQYGYYVLPFLLGDRVAARVDLKADRVRGVLLVPAAHVEPGNDPKRVASELGEHLRQVASWLGLGDVEVGNRGELAPGLARKVKERSHRRRSA